MVRNSDPDRVGFGVYQTAWVADTPAHRKNFERLVMAGRHRYGIDSHWLEECDAVDGRAVPKVPRAVRQWASSSP